MYVQKSQYHWYKPIQRNDFDKDVMLQCEVYYIIKVIWFIRNESFSMGNLCMSLTSFNICL